MAEAVGLAASIIAIVELSVKVSKLCVQYSTAAGNARADITRLQSRLKDLNICLEAAQRLLDDPRNTALAISRSLIDSLNSCKIELDEIQDKLDPGSARKAMRRFGLRALKWPFDSKEISTAISNLEHYKQTITLYLQVDQTTILLDMSQRVEGLSIQQRGQTTIARAPCFNVPFDRDNDFVARPGMTAWLRDKYSSSTGRMALVGMGGFGKSQVAINFAYSIHDEDSNLNIFWVHASSKPRFEEAYHAIAERMKLPKRDEPSTDIIALVRDWLQNDDSGSWLMILDNADDVNLFYPKGTDERPLASFLPKALHGTVLVTSRSLDVAERLTGSRRNIFQVTNMDEPQGLQLVKNKLMGDFDEQAAVKLLEALDHIPLAISQAVAYINRRSPRESVETYLEAFKQSDQRRASLLEIDLGDLRRDETVSNSVISTWKITFEKIRSERPSAALLLSFMSLFNPQGIPEFALHHYKGYIVGPETKAYEFEDDLDILRSYSLVSMTANRDVFELHATVQTCTRAWISSSDEMADLKRRFLDSMCDNFHYKKYEDWPTCQMLLPHLESVTQEEPSKENLDLWIILMERCAKYMINTGKYEAAEEISKKAIATGLPSLGEEHRTMHKCLSRLATAYRRQGKFDEAAKIQLQLVKTSERIWGEENTLTVNSTNDLARLYIRQCRYAQAEELLVRILESSRRTKGDRHPHILAMEGNLVLAYSNQQEDDKAKELGMQVLRSSPQNDDVIASKRPTFRAIAYRSPMCSSLKNLKGSIWVSALDNNKEVKLTVIELTERFANQEIMAHSSAPQTTEPSYQSYNNNPYQSQQQEYGQPPYPEQNQRSSVYQSHSGQPQQSYPGQQYSGHRTHSPQPQPQPYNTYQPPQQPQHQQWPTSPAPPSQSLQSAPAARGLYGAPAPPKNHLIQSPPTIVGPGTADHGHPCPTPPRWVPYWSDQSQQWFYVETSGRSSWQAPSELPPLLGMPAFPGSLNTHSRGHDGQMTHPGQPQYANPQDSRPSLPEKDKKSSTFLAAAGGFAAGGAAGYFVKERIDKRKAKKHGRTVDDFSDFAHFPAWEVDLECNICDQVISGPYAHCKKCDGGDYDICRDCLAQGEVCKGKGKQNLVKVYPKYYCDVCNLLIKGGFYYCSICNDGDWDTCQKCFDAGNTCRGRERGETHNLTHLYMPEPKFGKGSGKYDSSSSSDSD
ncbi:Kinesin light chain [Fusarium acutatum]|uniref:Kinesin light chain n=1 Tax=Fusarium acutatum TaxID=78861 RepID=A0A8H4JEI2_9HYPO|nr:Kinesin light chain [Fusarium acutatum]